MVLLKNKTYLLINIFPIFSFILCCIKTTYWEMVLNSLLAVYVFELWYSARAFKKPAEVFVEDL